MSREFSTANLEKSGMNVLKRKVAQAFKDYVYFKLEYLRLKRGERLHKQVLIGKKHKNVRKETARYLSKDYSVEEVGITGYSFLIIAENDVQNGQTTISQT